MAKKILFVCATGIVTSTTVTEKVIDYCKQFHITFEYEQTNVASIPSKQDADLIISTTNIPYETKIPVINGLPLITGMNEKETLEQIVEYLKG